MAYYGASVDSPETNRRFAESLDLDYPLLSDPGKDVARAYGVLRVGLFASRHTFYIDDAGTIALIDTKVKPSSAGTDVAANLTDLGVRRK